MGETKQSENEEAVPSVTNVYLNAQKRFAFIEFRSPQEATQAMELEGIQFFGESLKIGRPANYNPNLLPSELRPDNVPKLNTSKLGIVSNFVPNGPNKLYCGGIPYSLTEEQVKELLSTYGQLKAFFLAKDQSTGLSKGYCFFQYEDPSVTDSAIVGLNGIKIGDRQLAVRRHTPSTTQAQPMDVMMTSTNILILDQMVTAEDLNDDQEYQEIVQDVRDECSKYGTVKSITIPRPSDDDKQEIHGLGKVFVEFEAVDQAKQARDSLQGRTFENRVVVASFYPSEKYANRDFTA